MNGQPYWTARGTTDPELAALMEVAAAALYAEDQHLARILDAGSAHGATSTHPAIANVGHGLSYWVYETTLVYVIWRAWLESGHVAAWDWTLQELALRDRIRKGEGGLRYDLVLYESSVEPHMVFEAKWWNLDTDRVRSALDEDAAKLRGSRFFAKARKFLIVFWHEQESESARMFRDVEAYANGARFAIRGTARFEARFLGKGRERLRGFFVVGLLEV